MYRYRKANVARPKETLDTYGVLHDVAEALYSARNTLEWGMSSMGMPPEIDEDLDAAFKLMLQAKRLIDTAMVKIDHK